MESSHEDKFNTLLSDYHGSIRFTEGCGSRGQHYIDNAYEKLYTFVKENPQFVNRLPQKYTCHDDGMYGMSGGLAAFASIINR